MLTYVLATLQDLIRYCALIRGCHKQGLKCLHAATSKIRGPFSYTLIIDLFSLYVLFSQYRSCDNTPDIFFFQILSHSCVYELIIDKRQRVNTTYKLKRFIIIASVMFSFFWNY